MSETDELRAMLDERDVEWEDSSPSVSMKPWKTSYKAFNGEEVTVSVYDEPKWLMATMVFHTPEQAIAATLGADDGTRWHELFGTPERAANILALGCMGGDENVCYSCVFRECDGRLRMCGSIHTISTQMLEWLRGKAEE